MKLCLVDTYSLFVIILCTILFWLEFLYVYWLGFTGIILYFNVRAENIYRNIVRSYSLRNLTHNVKIGRMTLIFVNDIL